MRKVWGREGRKPKNFHSTELAKQVLTSSHSRSSTAKAALEALLCFIRLNQKSPSLDLTEIGKQTTKKIVHHN